MPRDKPWLKMWTDWLGDIKMDRLSLAEQGAWWRLISLCHECQHKDENKKLDGALVVAGSPLSLSEIMKALKISEEADKTVFNQMLEKMTTSGSLKWDSDILYVLHYEERQRAATDTKEARRERQRELREAKKREAEKNPSPPLNNIRDIEEEGEEETHAQSCHVNSVTLIKELTRCYEQYIGLMNPLDADRMREFSEYYINHEGKEEWVENAFKKTPVNKRRWPYVQAILERFIEEGGPDGTAGQGEREFRQPGADRRHPQEGDGSRGWPGWENAAAGKPEPPPEGD